MLCGPRRFKSSRPSVASCAWPGDRENVMAVRASAATRWILVFQPPRDLPIACGPFFGRTRTVRMHLDAGGVQRHSFELDLHDLRALQLLKGTVEHAQLGPAVHARVDGVPVAETLGQATPLAAVLGDVQDGVEHLQIAQADIAALPRQALGDLFELRAQIAAAQLVLRQR